jgi:acid stress chaperone HdeB
MLGRQVEGDDDMKNFWIFSVMVVAMSCAPHAVRAADRIDLNTVKCGEWIESGKENIGATMAWLDGYYKEDNDPPVIDFDKMNASAAKLGKFCAENKDLGLGTAAEKVLGKH